MVDSSVAMNWLMPDEDRTLTEAIMESVSLTGAVAPPLFRLEVGNSLLIGVRIKRISAGYVTEALALIGQLPLHIDPCGAEYVWSAAIEIAAAYGLTLYDATYLECAIRMNLPLATLDRNPGRAAEMAGLRSPWPSMRN